MSDNLDGPSVEMTLEMSEEQQRMKRVAALAAFYYMTLKAEEKLPDSLVHDLVVGWQASYLESELVD